MTGLLVHLPATVLAFWSWLAAHWPAAPRGCGWQYGHARGQAMHWVKVCGARPGLRSWPVLVRR